MPAQIVLNTDYNTPGQTDYASKLDTDHTLINTFAAEVAAELRATNTANSIIAQDILKETATAAGRFGVDEAQVAFTVGQTQIDVSSGRVFFAGQRVNIVAATLTGFTTGVTRWIAATLDGLLSVETSALQQAFDLVQINQVGATLQVGEVVDNLAGPSSRLLNSAETVNRIVHREDPDANVVGVGDPSIRGKGNDGTDEDAGLFHTGVASRLGVASQRTTSEGVGTPVQAQEWTERGQLQLFEQSRCIATATAENAGTSGGLAALNFDGSVRQEPLSYLANPWFTAPGNTFTQPADSQYDGTYLFTGFVVFPAGATGPFECDIVADGVTVAHARAEKAASGDTVLPLSGLGEMSTAATVQLRAATADVGAQAVDARIGFYLIGGRPTP